MVVHVDARLVLLLLLLLMLLLLLDHLLMNVRLGSHGSVLLLLLLLLQTGRLASSRVTVGRPSPVA